MTQFDFGLSHDYSEGINFATEFANDPIFLPKK